MGSSPVRAVSSTMGRCGSSTTRRGLIASPTDPSWIEASPASRSRCIRRRAALGGDTVTISSRSTPPSVTRGALTPVRPTIGATCWRSLMASMVATGPSSSVVCSSIGSPSTTRAIRIVTPGPLTVRHPSASEDRRRRREVAALPSYDSRCLGAPGAGPLHHGQ